MTRELANLQLFHEKRRIFPRIFWILFGFFSSSRARANKDRKLQSHFATKRVIRVECIYRINVFVIQRNDGEIFAGSIYENMMDQHLFIDYR